MTDGLGARLVHRESQARPIGRRTDATLLAEHHAACSLDELVHALEVSIPAEGRPALALLGEDPVEDELRGDARMVEAGQEERRAAVHPGVADHEVLDRGPLGVPEME